nr:uncharacterized protein LOC119185061 [Rhipicephalus microplus]
MLKDLLKTSLEDPGRTRHATREWKNLLAIVSSGTEFMWKQTLPGLRASIPKKTVPTTCSVRTTGQVSLPDYVENALKLGPKFAVEPRLSAPELLSLVRRISKCAPEGEANRCISEGVDVISRKNIGASRVPVSRVVSFLKQKRLCVLPADKEGGFVVLGEGDYDERACSAVAKVFNECNNVSLRKVKLETKRLCKNLGLSRLFHNIDAAKKDSLDIMFSAKTHKPEWPLRVIVSEIGSWQKNLALFLQERLGILKIDDPFLIRHSGEILDFLKSNPDKGFFACSFDIKDLYYSLPQNELIERVEECIDSFGVVAFQNSAEISVQCFLDLLRLYLRSTFATWNGKTFLQKQGICIGSCLAPVLSDIFLAHHDRNLAHVLSQHRVAKVVRYVDDYLVLFEREENVAVSQLEAVFSACLSPLVITVEEPTDSVLRFLDIELEFKQQHTCWEYKPRANKPLLPYQSAHSKLVKRSIANLCFGNALRKSCHHKIQKSVMSQSERLSAAGFPESIQVSVVEGLLKKCRLDSRPREADIQPAVSRSRVAVVPYLHKTAHNLKKVASRVGIKVVFSAPQKLGRISRLTDPHRKPAVGCSKKHRDHFVACVEGVVYGLPLTCGGICIGQTGRCLNDRLREHKLNVKNKNNYGHLSVHCVEWSKGP